MKDSLGSSSSHINFLPLDMLIHIFSYIPVTKHGEIALVCKFWLDLTVHCKKEIATQAKLKLSFLNAANDKSVLKYLITFFHSKENEFVPNYFFREMIGLEESLPQLPQIRREAFVQLTYFLRNNRKHQFLFSLLMSKRGDQYISLFSKNYPSVCAELNNLEFQFDNVQSIFNFFEEISEDYFAFKMRCASLKEFYNVFFSELMDSLVAHASFAKATLYFDIVLSFFAFQFLERKQSFSKTSFEQHCLAIQSAVIDSVIESSNGAIEADRDRARADDQRLAFDFVEIKNESKKIIFFMDAS